MKSKINYSITKANDVLLARLAEIKSVQKWAQALGFKNSSTFSRLYRNHYGIRPKRAMVKLRIEKAIVLLQNEPRVRCHEIAKIIGKKDEKTLNNYFMTHMNKPPSAFRTKNSD